MNTLVGLFLLLTTIMLAIHLSIWKLLQKWTESETGVFKRIVSPRGVVRFEASYWALALLLLILSSWSWSGWYFMIPIFFIIHLAVWLAAEFRNDERLALNLSTGLTKHAVVAFDLGEAVVLLAVAWQAASFLSAAGT